MEQNLTSWSRLEQCKHQDGNMAGWEVLWRRSCWRGGINEIVKLKKKMHRVNLKKKKVAKKGNSYLFSSVHCRD